MILVFSSPSCEEDDEARVSMTRVAPSDVEEEEEEGMLVMVQVEEAAAAGNRTGGILEALPSYLSRATKACGLGRASSTRRTGSRRGRNIPFAAGRGALVGCAGGVVGAGVASACGGARGLILLLRGCRLSICSSAGRVRWCRWPPRCSNACVVLSEGPILVCVGKGGMSGEEERKLGGLPNQVTKQCTRTHDTVTRTEVHTHKRPAG